MVSHAIDGGEVATICASPVPRLKLAGGLPTWRRNGENTCTPSGRWASAKDFRRALLRAAVSLSYSPGLSICGYGGMGAGSGCQQKPLTGWGAML